MFGKDCKRLKKLVDENVSNDDLSKAVVKEFGKGTRLDVVTLDNEVSAYMAASKMLSEDLDDNGYLITAMYIKKIEGDRIKLYVVSLKDNAEKEEDDDIPTVGELFVSLNNKWFEDNKEQLKDDELCKSIGDYVRKEIADILGFALIEGHLIEHVVQTAGNIIRLGIEIFYALIHF